MQVFILGPRPSASTDLKICSTCHTPAQGGSEWQEMRVFPDHRTTSKAPGKSKGPRRIGEAQLMLKVLVSSLSDGQNVHHAASALGAKLHRTFDQGE